MLLRFLPRTLLLCALLALAGAADAATLKIATIMPDGSSWLTEMRAAADEIKAATAGRVKLKFYPGGVMGADKTVLRKIRARQLQGGAFTSGSLAAVYPDIEIYSLPLLFRDQAEVSYVRERMDAKLVEGLEKKGLVALTVNDGGFAYLLTQQPVRQVGDLSGKKVWLPEDDIMSQTTLELAGVSAVPLPISDVYTALQTGLIETVASSAVGAIAFQWHTKVSYLTDVPLMYLMGLLVVDKKAFDKLSPADRAIVEEKIAAAGKRLDTEGRASELNAREALRNQGVEFVEVTSATELARWRDISTRAVAKLREMKRYSEANMQELLALLEAYRASPAAAR